MKYQFIKDNNMIFPVQKMAEIFQISPSSYYAWLKRKPGIHELRDQEILPEIKLIFK